MKFKRIAALLLLVCLLALTGCAGRTQTAILCVKKGVVAAQALCESDQTLSYALAEDDAAALQQLESGQCDFALVTAQGWQQAKDAGYDAAERLNDVTLAQFVILSRAGGTAQWGRNTRVVIVGAAEADGDVLARQVLTCALYGTVRNTDWESALSSLRGKRADIKHFMKIAVHQPALPFLAGKPRRSAQQQPHALSALAIKKVERLLAGHAEDQIPLAHRAAEHCLHRVHAAGVVLGHAHQFFILSATRNAQQFHGI